MTDWEEATAALEAANTAYEAYHPRFEEIVSKYEAGRPSMDVIPWEEFPFVDRNHVARKLDLDKYWSQFLASEGKTWGARDPDAVKKRTKAAIDAVSAFREAEKRHVEKCGLDEAYDRIEELSEAVYQAEWRRMDIPAPDHRALFQKLSKLLEIDQSGSVFSWSEKAVRQTRLDMRRLLLD